MIEFTRTKDSITPSLDRITRELDRLPGGAFDTWLTNTPRRTGNARNRTRLRGNNIVTTYGYAVPLDQGRSRQSPDGMSRPTLAWMRQQLRRIFRK